MIMKRKLPSQTEKLDEDLLEKEKKPEAEQQNNQQEQTSPQDEAAGASQPPQGEEKVDTSSQDQSAEEQKTDAGDDADEDISAAPEPPQTEEQAPDDSQSDSQSDSQAESEAHSDTQSEPASETLTDTLAVPPQNAQEQDPSEIPDPFVHSAEEDDMTLAAPPQRPDAEPESGGVQRRQHKVSAEALLGDEKAQDKTPEAEAPVREKPAAAQGQDESPQTQKSEQSPQQKEEDLSALFPEGKQSPVTPDESDDDTWDLGDLVDVPDEAGTGGSPFESPEKKPDVEPDKQTAAPPPGAEKLPPWKRKRTGDDSGGGGKFTPKLPQVAREAPAKMGALVSLGLVVLLIGGTVVFYQNRDAAVETISRWTGTLGEVGQPVPAEANGQQAEGDGSLQAESVVRQQQGQQQGQQQAGDSAAGQQQRQQDGAQRENINLEVLDVAPDEADEPIVGGDDVEMPEDVDKFTALQEAVAQKRAERRKEGSATLEGEEEPADPSQLSPEEITRRNLQIIRQTNASLAEYRKALADVDDPARKPRPGKFLREQGQKNGTLPPPQQAENGQAGSRQAQQQQQQQQQPRLYGNKVVSDLSELVAEKQEKETGVRTLEDFDVSVFDPRRPQVSIPKGITPRLSKEDFPQLEVFSFVPDQGIVGKTRGQEGVLLLGETLEGWELVEVFNNYAEFQKNGKKRIVTFNDANR